MAAGGGSGGHVTPVAAVLGELARMNAKPLEVRFVTDRAFEEQARTIMQAAPVPVDVRVILAGKLRRYKHFGIVDYITTPSVLVQNLFDVVKLVIGVGQAIWQVGRFRPDIVFAKGGYVCLPVGLAARFWRVPLVIHDSDARPGLTNRLLAPFATAIATGYPLENYTYDKARSHYTGVPIRRDFRPLKAAAQAHLKRTLGYKQDQLLVVAFGGGLGARSINHAMVAAAEQLAAARIQTVLIAGKSHYESTKRAAAEYAATFEVRDFVADGMIELLSAADVVVTRASATSLQELAGLKKTVVAVPARQLADQHKNAAVYEAADAAVVLRDDDLDQGALGAELIKLLASSDRRQQLAAALHTFARPDAAHAVATLLNTHARRR